MRKLLVAAVAVLSLAGCRSEEKKCIPPDYSSGQHWVVCDKDGRQIGSYPGSR